MKHKNTEENSLQNEESKQLSMNVPEKENNSNSLIKRIEVINTPFRIIETEKGSFIALGDQRLTDYITTKECYKMINERSWELLLTVMTVVYDKIAQLENIADKMAL